MKKKITITPVRVADLLAEGERMPVYVHVIDHPDARVLVDTGLTELHPAVADMDPRLQPLSQQGFDLAGIDLVVNTHLHFDHCGGNHLFAGPPIYVQRRELDDARSRDDYTIREWVEAPGVQYVPVDGEFELLPGLRLVPAPGHTRGLQMVVVETAGVRSSSAATSRSGSASSTSRTPKASCACARSTPSWSGSRTRTSRGDLVMRLNAFLARAGVASRRGRGCGYSVECVTIDGLAGQKRVWFRGVFQLIDMPGERLLERTDRLARSV